MTKIIQLIKQTRRYLRKYQYDKVIENSDKILKIDCKSNWALKYKGISYIQTGKYKEGLKCLERLNKLNPNNSDTIYTIASAYEKLGNNNEAIKYYDMINDDTLAGYKRKHLLTRMGEYDRLINECDEKIISLEKGDNKVNKIMGLLEEKAIFHYRKREYDKAYQILKEVSHLYPDAYKTMRNNNKGWYSRLSDYLEEYPDSQEFFKEFFKVNDDYNCWRGRLRYSLSYADEFLFADILIESNPDNLDILEIYGDAFKYRYTHYSIECYEKILQTDRKNTNAIESIIDIYKRIYLKDKALKFIDSVMQYNHNIDLLRCKIEILESMSLYENALECYDEYFNLRTRSTTDNSLTVFDKIYCMEQYAIESYQQNNPQKAYEILKEASYLYQNISQIIRNEYQCNKWYEKILIEALDKSQDNPVNFFNTFLKPDNEETQIWIERIRYLHQNISKEKPLGNPIEYCDMILLKSPDNYKILLTKAYIIMHPQYKVSDSRKIMEIYDKVLKIKPDNKEALNYKFHLLINCDEYDEAYQLLQQIEYDYNIIEHNLEIMAEYYLNQEEYHKASYCYELILNEIFNYDTLKKLKYAWIKADDNDSQRKSPYYMDWIKIIKDKYEDNTCPECKGNLIPVKYGVIIEEKDMQYRNNKYHASEQIKTHNNRPTDYCSKCNKRIYLGFCGIKLKEDNSQLADYTKQILTWIIEELEKNPKKSIKDLEKDLYHEYSINQEEFKALLDKLEEIKFIEKNNNQIHLWDEYDKFKGSIAERQHFRTKIFKDKDELNNYALTCNEFKNYKSFEEYLEDVRICIMANWKKNYMQACEEVDISSELLRKYYRFKLDAYEIGWDWCFVGF